MEKCMITVLKRHFNKDLAKKFGVVGLSKCPMHKEGQTYFSDCVKPEKFCDEAWKAIYQYVFALAHGSEIFFNNDWIKIPGVAICSCNDGIRPVIFKIERVNEEIFLKAIASQSKQLRYNVMALANKGWTMDEISNALKISRSAVELIIEISSKD